jgi:3',5'-cyclic AMP phosphodiesterase CpdA
MTATAAKMRFNTLGVFKILQIADVHFTTPDAPSRNWNVSAPNGGQKTLDFFDRVLQAEQPDLVVFTGDNTDVYPARPALDAIFNVCQRRAVPFALVLGNHDGECSPAARVCLIAQAITT